MSTVILPPAGGYSKELLEKISSDRWLNLDKNQKFTSALKPTLEDKENPHLYLFKLFRKPENLYFTAKYVFGVDLALFQMVILQEMYKHTFPMLVASRGASKCVTADTYIMLDDGITRMDQYCHSNMIPQERYEFNKRIYGENGFKNPSYVWANGKKNIIKLVTSQGYELKCTPNHPIRVVRGDKIEWVEAKDIKLDDIIPIDRTENWFEKTNDLTENHGYLFGALIGDGGYTVRGVIGFTTADQFMADEVNRCLINVFGKVMKKSKNKYQYYCYSTSIYDKLFGEYGFNSPVCAEKDIPKSMLKAPKNVVRAFLQGLFDTDGATYSKAPVVGYCSKSENLVKGVQFLLLRFGVTARVVRRLNTKYNRYYWNLMIGGPSLRRFYENVGFRLPRKTAVLQKHINKKCNPNLDVIPKQLYIDRVLRLRRCLSEENKKRFSIYKFKKYDISYANLHSFLNLVSKVDHQKDDFDCVAKILNKNYFYDRVRSLSVDEDYTYDFYIPEDHSFITNGLISHNSYSLAFYAMWKAFINPGSQIVITASSFRQAKFVFTYAAKIFEKAKILQDILGYRKGSNEKIGPKWDTDRCEMYIGESTIIAIPLGHDGGKIRGQRASTLIIDERATVPTDVVQRVLFGFAAVSQDPVEKMKRQARMDALKELGLWTPDMDDEERKMMRSNQSIVSGSAYYQFNDFYKEFCQYREIIKSNGDRDKLEELFGGDVPEGISHKDFCIIRLPYELLPKGFMDDKTISKARATFSKSTFLLEYSACFVGDSEGFFRRSLIESCVTHKPIQLASGERVKFSARLKGSTSGKYVYGIDPASEQDNFAIAVLEVYEDHSRLVYCWTSRKDTYRKKVAAGKAIDQNFYYYCVSKIRELMLNFPCLRMGIDSQGGGNQIIDMLADTNLLRRGEQPVLEVKDPDEPKPSDNKHGLHIIEKIQFVKSSWTSEANHGLKSDLENKNLLLPYLDVAELAVRTAEKDESRDGETLEDCVAEIEELKDELATIVMTQTENGTERWDTPATKGEGGKKVRSRKDRYSALLIANAVARSHRRAIAHAPPPYVPVGGDASKQTRIVQSNEMYVAPAWVTAALNNVKLYRGV